MLYRVSVSHSLSISEWSSIQSVITSSYSDIDLYLEKHEKGKKLEPLPEVGCEVDIITDLAAAPKFQRAPKERRSFDILILPQVADQLLHPPLPEMILNNAAYHLQQAVEKALKGALECVGVTVPNAGAFPALPHPAVPGAAPFESRSAGKNVRFPP